MDESRKNKKAIKKNSGGINLIKKLKNKLVQLIKPIFNLRFFKKLITLWHTNINEKLRGSYSQKGEDLIIDKLLHFKKSGFYVDVGANHPTACSNTARFFKRGWSGINIEPNPKNILLFKKERSKDINLGVGIANKTGKIEYYEFSESMLSTFSKEEAIDHIQQGKKLIKKYPIKVTKLSNILNKYAKKEIDLLSIDTEGLDMEVLKSNDWKKFKPKIICLESASRGYKEDYSKIFETYLSKYGYKKVAETRLNSIYMRVN